MRKNIDIVTLPLFYKILEAVLPYILECMERIGSNKIELFLNAFLFR